MFNTVESRISNNKQMYFFQYISRKKNNSFLGVKTQSNHLVYCVMLTLKLLIYKAIILFISHFIV